MDYNEDESKAYLGRGWSFPLQLESDIGQFTSVQYAKDIEQAIYIILSTAKGERVMRPDFGCGIHELVFDVINTGLITQIKESVESALTEYEARIEVLKVDVNGVDVQNGRLEVRLDYRIHNTNQTGNYVYPFYFREAS